MKKSIMAVLLAGIIGEGMSQTNLKFIKGMYIQWGYNKEWYTKSTIHFRDLTDGIRHDFTIYHAVAHDQGDLDALYKKPMQISIPQYNYRIGFYLNDTHSKAIELNYDHTKYIVDDFQRLHAKGSIGSKYFDKDTAFIGTDMHLEHTNGANFYHINFVQQYLFKNKNGQNRFSILWKAGGGVLIPKTDIMLSGRRMDNCFHIAGYCLGAEGGGRWYAGRKLFFESTAKTGFANYTNALTPGVGKVNHYFGYFELIGTIGYDIKF
jgi:hypothetical protein